MRKFAVFDIDGTLFRWQLFHELVFELKDQHYFSTEAGEQLDQAVLAWRAKEATWHEYEQTVIAKLYSELRNISPRAFEHAAEVVVRRSGKKLYGFTKRLLEDLKKEGYFLIALSGSQQEIAERFAELYGFDVCVGTLYERDGDTFTGNFVRFVPDNKASILQGLVKEHTLTFDESTAVGDTAGDISMLKLATRPIAFNPSDELRAVAQENGWDIVIERKDVAYTLRKDADGRYVLAHTDIV